MSGTYTLFGNRGSGSALVAAALELSKLPYHYQEVDYSKDCPERDRLLELNPLGQVPTLLLPDGTVMTESAAIILLLHIRWPLAGLVPSGEIHFPAFLRWLMLINTAIYPTFTYGDTPQKWLPGVANPQVLTDTTNAHRKTLWQRVNAAADPEGPWFLGPTFCAIDLYIAVMSHWRPGEAWFAEHCSKLSAIAAQVAKHPRLEALFEAEFA
jgi:GST-like protein